MTMDDSVVMPRISAPQLECFIGKTVKIVGKVLGQANNTTIVIETGDLNQIQVCRPYNYELTEYAEFICTVNDDLSVTEHLAINFGSDFDLNSYSRCLKLAQQHPGVF